MVYNSVFLYLLFRFVFNVIVSDCLSYIPPLNSKSYARLDAKL